MQHDILLTKYTYKECLDLINVVYIFTARLSHNVRWAEF